MSPPEPSSNPAGRCWEYRGAPRPARTGPRDPFCERLIASLRLATAWPVDVQLEWTTGPRATVRLAAATSPSIGWVHHALLPVYPVGSWVESFSPAASLPRRASGRALRGPDRPFRRATELATPWSDTVAAALGVLPPGAGVEWRLRPRGMSTTEIPLSPVPLPQPAGWRLPAPTETARRLEDSVARRSVAPLWELRGTLFGRDVEVADALGRLVASAAREDGGNGVAWHRPSRWFPRRADPILLAIEELAAWFPSPALRLPDGGRSLPAGSRGLALGRTVAGRVSALPVEPRQGRHALLLGETGMGKSTALVQLAVRAAALGGVAFFDPIGDTSRRLIDRLPPAALGRVVWISPSCSPVAINALALASSGPPIGERALGDLVQALRRVRAGRYSEAPYWGPRVEEVLTLSLRAATRYPQGTLREALTLLDGIGGSARGVPPEAEDAVGALFDRVRNRPEEVDGARRVLGEVVGNPTLTRMLAARDARFSVGGALEAGRVVIVSGDAPELGESASRTLLSVHLAIIWLELMARRSRGKAFLVADELQWYANDAVAEFFRLGRRFNVHVWAATQSLASLPEPIREAAVTNAADLVVFRGSPDDARELARWAPDVSAESVLGLRRGEAAVLVGKGGEVGWVQLPFEPDRRRPDRWASVWAQCRELWGPPAESTPSPGESGGEAESDSAGTDPVRRVLLVLWSGLLASGGAESVTVRVDALREVVDPAGVVVRSVGQRLAAAGALEADHSPAGRLWTVRRSGVVGLLGSGVSPEELAAADPLWERVRSTSMASGAQKGL